MYGGGRGGCVHFCEHVVATVCLCAFVMLLSVGVNLMDIKSIDNSVTEYSLYTAVESQLVLWFWLSFVVCGCSHIKASVKYLRVYGIYVNDCLF